MLPPRERGTGSRGQNASEEETRAGVLMVSRRDLPRTGGSDVQVYSRAVRRCAPISSAPMPGTWCATPNARCWWSGTERNHTGDRVFAVKNFWRRWTHEIPLVAGDALWEVLVVQFAAFLDRLTVRKVIEFVVIAMLVMAFAQTLPIDLAILFAGDTLMYLEFVVAFRLAAGTMHILEMLRFALRLAHLAMRGLNSTVRLPGTRLNRPRERRQARA